MGDGSSSPAEESAGAGGAIIEVASQRVTCLGGVLARRRPPTASPSSRRMPEPNTRDRNSRGSRVDEFRTAKLRRGYSGAAPSELAPTSPSQPRQFAVTIAVRSWWLCGLRKGRRRSGPDGRSPADGEDVPPLPAASLTQAHALPASPTPAVGFLALPWEQLAGWYRGQPARSSGPVAAADARRRRPLESPLLTGLGGFRVPAVEMAIGNCRDPLRRRCMQVANRE